jgi:8-oxo-dGTP diphosphatase
MKYQRVAVSAFIPHNDRVLIVQRAADEKFLPDMWELVGGKVEWGENPYLGLVREVKEEAGIIVKPLQPYYVSDYTPNKGRHMVEIGIICKIIGSSTIKLSLEHQDYYWATEEEIRNHLQITEWMKQEILIGFEFLRRWKP